MIRTCLIIAAVILCFSSAFSQPLSYELKKGALLHGQEIIPIDVHIFEEPIILVDNELQGDRPKPQWLKAMQISAERWEYSFDEIAAVHAKDTVYYVNPDARALFDEQKETVADSMRQWQERYEMELRIQQLLYYKFKGKEMLMFPLENVRTYDKETDRTHSGGRTLNLFVREDAQWKITSQQQAGPHIALLMKPEEQRSLLLPEEQKLTESPIQWQQRKILAVAEDFSETLAIPFTVTNISNDPVTLELAPNEHDRLLSASLDKSTIATDESSTIELVFGVSSKLDETISFQLLANGSHQEFTAHVYARNMLAIRGDQEFTTSLSEESLPLRLFSELISNQIELSIIQKPQDLSVELVPDHRVGHVWTIELEKQGANYTGEVLIRLDAENGQAQVKLIVEE